ncbi:MAG: hypothetical protein E6K63_04185 [Nitrospirae bacterium]|nr:MAG: hypothetical protein E6K63_04185 [Nitrospirota bacterium]
MTSLFEAQRKQILAEVLKVQGLMPLLMKPRNGQRWTQEDRAQLRAHLRRIFSLSPLLLVLVIPGSFLALLFLSWWLDRRRTRRRVDDQRSAMPAKSSGE